MTGTGFKPRLYIAGLPKCPLHSILLKSRYLNLTSDKVVIIHGGTDSAQAGIKGEHGLLLRTLFHKKLIW